MANRKSGFQKETIEIALIGINSIIGDEDVIRNGCYQTSCICAKLPDNGELAEVLKIEKDKFLSLLPLGDQDIVK